MTLLDGIVRVIAVAPHPDDDALGCGGTLALAADANLDIRVIYVTDGSASHPGSSSFPPHRLREIRESEALAGLAALGIAPRAARFLRWPDGTVPAVETPGGRTLVDAVEDEISRGAGTLLLGPWRRDPHPDHRAVAAIVERAAEKRNTPLAQYAVWLDERGEPADRPHERDGRIVTLDISAVRDRKRRAIEAHRSQRGLVIHDADVDFRLPATLIEHALEGTERFVLG